MLVRLKPKPGEKKRVWLLIKEKDTAAAPGRDILEERPESVKSGRRIEELAPAAPVKVGRLRPGALAGAVKGPGPERLTPQLASPVERPPEGGDWLHEIKLDGYRTLAFRDGEAVRLVTRGGLDWTHRYGDLAEAFRALPCREAVVDGEIVVQDEGGVSRFALLQDALSRGARNELVFFAFDLVRLDGWNLAGVPLAKRKGLLRQLLAGATGRSAIQFSDHVEGGGAGFYEQVSRMGLEGVVSKRASAVYHPGRSKTWVKCKAKLYGDFVIVGYTASAAAGGLGALALGEWVDGELVYRGKVGTGFDAATLADLLARLKPLEDRELAIAGAPKDVRWVRPVLSVKVEYSNLTSDGSVRHGVFKGLREVARVRAGRGAEAAGLGGGSRERLGDQPDAAAVRAGGADEARRGGLLCGGRRLHAAASLRAAGEPGALPDGEAGGLLLPAAPVPGDAGGGGELRDADERRGGPDLPDGRRCAKGYLALAQFGVVEFHTWGCLVERLERADRVVLDLDPGEGVAWREVVEAAVHVRGELAARGLVGFAKTTGGKGVHVVVPVTPKLDWKAVHAAAGALAAAIAAGAPETFTTVMGASNRKRRIFIDFHRNARSATAVAPYSLRARNNLPASAPLGWEDLEKVDAPEDLNYSSLPGLVAATGDPWADIEDFARDLPRRRGSVRGERDGAEGFLEGVSEAEPGELPGAALSGDERERAGAVQPAAQGDAQPDQHEAGGPGARAGRAVGPGEGLRVRGQEVHHHRRRATSRR